MAAVNPSAIPVVPENARPRLDSVDLLRGIAMVLMALGHVRMFVSNDLLSFYPRELALTHAALFLTQWVCRFCSPIFLFVAGIAVFLSSRRKTKGELARFLLTRGLWLLFLEMTVVKFAWLFEFNPHFFGASVLWTLGWSMILLSGLIRLPTWAVAAVGAVIIATHNLFDHVRSESLGAFGWLWTILHEPGRTLELWPGLELFFFYPLVPWIGVMASGYGLGTLLRAERAVRRKNLLWLGAILTVAFIVIRLSNVCGDPRPWSAQSSALFTIFSFINCETLPPSLLHLLMTLGPAIILLALFDHELGKASRFILVFGRVPLFFYLIHVALIHGIAVLLSYARYGRADWLFGMTPDPDFADLYPVDYGYGLPGIYLIWLVVIAIMFPLCRWFGGVKQRRRSVWLSYF